MKHSVEELGLLPASQLVKEFILAMNIRGDAKGVIMRSLALPNTALIKDWMSGELQPGQEQYCQLATLHYCGWLLVQVMGEEEARDYLAIPQPVLNNQSIITAVLNHRLAEVRQVCLRLVAETDSAI